MAHNWPHEGAVEGLRVDSWAGHRGRRAREGAAGSDARGLWARGRAKNGEVARGGYQGLRTSGLHPRPLFGCRWYLVPPGMVGTEARQKASEWGARRFPQRARRLRAGRGRGRTGVRRRVLVSDQLGLAIAHKLLNDARVGDVPLGLELRPHLEPLDDEQVAVHRPVLQALEPLPVQPLHADHVRGAAHAEPCPPRLRATSLSPKVRSNY